MGVSSSWLTAPDPKEGDVAEELGDDAVDLAGAAADDRHVGAAAPAAVGEEAQGLGVDLGAGFGGDVAAGADEGLGEALLPATVGTRLLRGVGDEAGKWAGDGWHVG